MLVDYFTINKQRIQKFNETGDSRYFSQNKLDKVCFQHDVAYEYFKDYLEDQILLH